jgi:hypothetical protein
MTEVRSAAAQDGGGDGAAAAATAGDNLARIEMRERFFRAMSWVAVVTLLARGVRKARRPK